jgi:hypothetical protein
MMKRHRIPRSAIPGLLMALATAFPAHGKWSLELYGGADHHFSSPLTVQQDGFRDLKFAADYEGRPLEDPIYFGVRLGLWRGHAGWELEFLHDKLFLINRPAEIQRFELTDGNNFFTVNRAWDLPSLILRVGAGVVITNPETTIRGRSQGHGGILGTGYHISGPVLQIGSGKRLSLWPWLFALLEAKATASYARVPIADGHADVVGYILHAHVGFGFNP